MLAMNALLSAASRLSSAWAWQTDSPLGHLGLLLYLPSERANESGLAGLQALLEKTVDQRRVQTR